MKTIVTVTTMFLAIGVTAGADVIDWTASTAVIPAEAVDASVMVVPDGSGVPFTEAFAADGQGPVDATITATLLDVMGDPVADYPADDIWLQTSDGGLAACSQGTAPDADSDANGQVVWTSPPRAGGHSEGEGVRVYVAGAPIAGAPLPLLFNSPDISGDLQVDLTDIVAFTQALSTYTFAADFNNDAVIDLSDIVRFTPGIGALCP